MKRPGQPPLAVQLETALRQLGMTRADAELDHDPPLALRERDPETGRYTPDANDPAHLVWRLKADHREKTSGPKHDSSQGDIGKIAKARRIGKREEDFRSRLLSKAPGSKPKEKVSRWPKRKLRS